LIAGADLAESLGRNANAKVHHEPLDDGKLRSRNPDGQGNVEALDFRNPFFEGDFRHGLARFDVLGRERRDRGKKCRQQNSENGQSRMHEKLRRNAILRRMRRKENHFILLERRFAMSCSA
jgi:hypothetical protein